MSAKLSKIGIAAALGLAGLGLCANNAAAQNAPPIVAGGAAATGAWPVWVLGGGVISVMVRAAVVHNTECRELTFNEAVTGFAPVWPLMQTPNNRCGAPLPPGCQQGANPPGATLAEAQVLRIPRRCRPPVRCYTPTSQAGQPPAMLAGATVINPRPRRPQRPSRECEVLAPVAGAVAPIVMKY